MDRASVFTINTGLPKDDSQPGDQPEEIQKVFRSFISEFRLDNNFVYRDALRTNILIKLYMLDVDVAHLISFHEDLAQRLTNEPAEILPIFESAVKDVAQRMLFSSAENIDQFTDCQVVLHSNANLISIRDLNASYISKLVRIPGIIIGASTMSSKAVHLQIMCRNCRQTKVLHVLGGFQGVSLPRMCDRETIPGEEKCSLDPYFIVHEKSTFIDQQVLKLQEAPDMVPVGELPRHILISADRYLTNTVVPGSRCTVMGIFSVYQSKSGKGAGSVVAIRNPYIRLVGIQSDLDASSKGLGAYSEAEEQGFLEMSRNPRLYEMFSNSIGPSIYGNTDIKKAITCLLFGGSKKVLPDGMRLRGDINVLLLGDPGTAKSQLLKFVEKVAPIAIYTSGKGSSAAGLTASVQRDHQSREFYLEGGAMVLADGGVVCIDEFDKMRDEDRVAIHEAMEQQTISIAKAGITTILNARTSVLAAANPIFGRYDDLKSPGENIDFQTTILSRFDMIFIVKDEHNTQRDETLSKFVMNLHMNRLPGLEGVSDSEGEISIERMKRYITYCKTRCAPRLSPEASEKLSSHFVQLRKKLADLESASNERSSIPITIRQLEAIIRITESMAKLQLSPIATEEHVDEAIRLFLASTMDAVGQGAGMNGALMEEAGKVEAELRRRLPIGWSTSLATLKRELCSNRGYSEMALSRALVVLSRRETVQLRNGGANVYRSGV